MQELQKRGKRRPSEEQKRESRSYKEEVDLCSRKLEEMERELKRAKEELREIKSLRTLFTRTASHDLRNILSAISGAAMILNKDRVDESIRKEMLSILNRNVTDMEALLDQMLDYSRLSSAQESLSIESFDPVLLFAELETIFRPIAKEKGLELKTRIDPSLPKIESDRLKVRQITSNLLVNAIRYTAKGSVELSAGFLDSNNFFIAVKDTGYGTEPEQFEPPDEDIPLSTNRAARQPRLGLALTRRLVALLGGSITLESLPGKGSSFLVLLPKK